jgi:hypothetical protein
MCSADKICFMYGLQCYIEIRHMFTVEYYIHMGAGLA